VILMTSGRYGRMRLGRCVRVDFGFVGCSSDVIDVLDRHCSGRQECSLRIPDPEMDERRPCLSDLTRYLEASYRCIPGQTVHLSRSQLRALCYLRANLSSNGASSMKHLGKSVRHMRVFYNYLLQFRRGTVFTACVSVSVLLEG